jgi:hypothetical protein
VLNPVAPLAFVLLSLVAMPQQAGTPPAAPPNPALAAMKRLDFLVGQWEGTGWIQMGPRRATFRQRETVRYAAGGTVVIIDGLGHSQDPGRQDRIVHQAFAVVSYDAASQAFRWRAYRAADGNEITAQPEVGTDKLVWGFDLPQSGAGHVRFTITRTAAGDWLEVGEMQRPSGEWMQFFEMTLKPVAASAPQPR